MLAEAPDQQLDTKLNMWNKAQTPHLTSAVYLTQCRPQARAAHAS